uniref:Membrane-associated 30 kDa protein, chloroplastic n=1 Tax=Aegilops tauschii TaxID=37682 RepID=M8BQK2_AEGTA
MGGRAVREMLGLPPRNAGDEEEEELVRRVFEEDFNEMGGGVVLRAEDVARAAVFLASDDARSRLALRTGPIDAEEEQVGGDEEEGKTRASVVTRLRRQPNVKRYKCNVIRSNLFDRLTRVARSYANAVISSFEDPEKILDQAVLEMNDDLIKMRQATAQDFVAFLVICLSCTRFLYVYWASLYNYLNENVLASQKRLENKCKAAQQADADWYRRAQLALQKGDEELAREALKRRKSYADNASSLKTQLDQQRSVVENLVSNTKLLESKIAEARQKKDTLKARAQSAKTATKVSEMLGNVNTSSALSAFEKMEEKVMTMESQAEALGQLGADDLEGKFAMLETTSVDDDLAQMRKELSGSSLKGELPQGRTATPRDRDIERELNELREKANDY